MQELTKWDRVGMVLSTLCAAHCLVTPFITLSLPFWVYTIHYSPVHLFLAFFIFPVAIYSFYSGFKKHHHKQSLFIGMLGLLMLAASLLILPSSRNQLRWNDIVTLIGSFLLVFAHGLNRWYLKRRD